MYGGGERQQVKEHVLGAKVPWEEKVVVRVSAFAAVTAVKVVEPMAILARVAVKAEVVMDTVGLVAAAEGEGDCAKIGGHGG